MSAVYPTERGPRVSIYAEWHLETRLHVLIPAAFQMATRHLAIRASTITSSLTVDYTAGVYRMESGELITAIVCTAECKMSTRGSALKLAVILAALAI